MANCNKAGNRVLIQKMNHITNDAQQTKFVCPVLEITVIPTITSRLAMMAKIDSFQFKLKTSRVLKAPYLQSNTYVVLLVASASLPASSTQLFRELVNPGQIKIGALPVAGSDGSNLNISKSIGFGRWEMSYMFR